MIYKDLITSCSFLFASPMSYLHYPTVFIQRMLLPTIRCLAGRHLSGDKYPFPHCCAGPCVSTAFKPVSHPGTSPGHKTVLTISCCKSLCDTTPWSMSSSWLRTSKLLSLKSRRCFHIFRGGGGGCLTVVHKSICSLCSHIYNLLYRSSCGSPDGAPLLRVLCCTVLFTPPWHLGQGICANR